MKKVLLVSDSFKGTMSSRMINRIAQDVVSSSAYPVALYTIPVADGGEGTCDCFLDALEGNKVLARVHGPRMEEMEAEYAIFGETAVIEMAAAAGLPLAGNHPDPSLTTTYGVGEIMADAVGRGVRKIILGLGGSCTNDGGCGAAAAMGVRFFDQNGDEFVPAGATLTDIEHIDCSGTEEKLKNITVEVMCDIDNPLCGSSGAAAVFGPQKGAGPEMVALLDRGLQHLAALWTEETARETIQKTEQARQQHKAQELIEISTVPGAGAAGGFGAGAMMFFGGKLRPGIDTILDMISFEELLKDCDLVITGEGKLDSQSLRGKVPVGVSKRVQKFDRRIPVMAVVGCSEISSDEALKAGISEVVITNDRNLPMDQVMTTCESDYRKAFAKVIEKFLADTSLPISGSVDPGIT